MHEGKANAAEEHGDYAKRTGGKAGDTQEASSSYKIHKLCINYEYSLDKHEY